MDFFSSVLKNTVNKVETLGRTASAAVSNAVNHEKAEGEEGDSTTGEKQQSSPNSPTNDSSANEATTATAAGDNANGTSWLTFDKRIHYSICSRL